MAWYQGPSRITVLAVDADFPQRAVVRVRRGGTIIVPGTVGETRQVEGDFDLALEHEFNGEWCPNIRALQGKWQIVNGVRSQLIRSKDRDWPGDTTERNLVLRVDRADHDEPARSPEQAPAARLTTMTGGIPATPTAGGAARMTTSSADVPASVRTATSGG